MHPYVQEAILVTAIVGGLIWAYETIPAGLQEVKDAARSPGPDEPEQPPTRQLDPEAEDKIELKTLRVLSESPSHLLRNAAIKIVASRAVNHDNRKLLLRHLASKNYRHRDNAIRAMCLLFYGAEGAENTHRNTQHKRFQDKEAFDAIITALVNTLPYHKRNYEDTSKLAPNNPPSPIRPLRRPYHEEKLVHLLLFALQGGNRSRLGMNEKEHLDTAISAGLVTRWLANYPFPCTLPQFSKYNYKKSDVCGLFSNSRFAVDDPDMNDIIRMVLSSPKGSNQLREVGLKASRITEHIDQTTIRRRRGSLNSYDSGPPSVPISEVDSDVRMMGGEDTAGEPMTNWTPIERFASSEQVGSPHLRPQDHSREEVSLRRRNREAIVVANRGEPLGRDNILRRVDSATLQNDNPFPWTRTGPRHLTRPGDVADGSSSSDSMPELQSAPSNPVLAAANAISDVLTSRMLIDHYLGTRSDDRDAESPAEAERRNGEGGAEGEGSQQEASRTEGAR